MLNFDRKKLLLLGYYAIKLIRNDMKKGIFQNDTKNHKYSKTYAKYKKNDMRKFGRGKDKKGRGERLKQYKGVSITSHETKFVNLILTGSLMRNITAQDLNNGVRINFAGKDTGKILGAQELDRDIVQLREENQEKVTKLAEKLFANDVENGIKFENIRIVVNRS